MRRVGFSGAPLSARLFGSRSVGSQGVAAPLIAGNAAIRSLNEGVVAFLPDGSLDVRTPAAAWSYAARIGIRRPWGRLRGRVGWRLVLHVDVSEGRIGIFSETGPDGHEGPEQFVDPPGPRRVAITIGSPGGFNVVVRQASESGQPSCARIIRLTCQPLYQVSVANIVADIMPSLVLHPGPQALRAIAEAKSRVGVPTKANEIGSLVCDRQDVPVLPGQILTDDIGRTVWQATEELIALLPTYQPRSPSIFAGNLIEKYFRQTAIRVYQLAKTLSRFGVTGGSVVEIGARFGNFAYPLTKLGYKVTALDRYREFGDALSGYKKFLGAAGVEIVETDKTTEVDVSKALGQYDVSMAMAVVEHIPHTPREFLGMLVDRAKPGGAVVLDTPNIADYWNRKRFALGQSIHQDIRYQFYSDIPFPGHHREYTAAELRWMLREVGCEKVCSTLFNPNVLQFDKLPRAHIDALMSSAIDPDLANTALVFGIRS